MRASMPIPFATSRTLAPDASQITETALTLAEEPVKVGALPTKAENDALHIAIAAIHRVPYLLTWNCRHMANATMRAQIENVCASRGFKAPIICTPEEMMKVKP